MARAKRSQAPNTEADPQTRKRARLSDVIASDDEEDAAATAASYDDDVMEGATALSGDDYTQRRDAGFADLEDEDLDTQRATQIIQRRLHLTMDNMPADNGIIEAITCINFMCHSKLHVSLGPLINFIIGHNGSGKSAVLTALTLCLGGKAAATNRGQNLKSFIKHGEESATLIVKLKNAGSTGYQQELYGDSIIVERHFTKSGASGFKVKAANGRLISIKKADLEDICDYFALQLDNPMNVLTQDMARQFLSNSSPAEKYRFFMKGVQLEQLDQDYQLLEETIDQIESKLATREEDVKVLEERAAKTAARLALSDRQDTLRVRIRNYSTQMAWAQVEEQERILEAIDEDIRRADSRIEASEKKVEEASQIFDDACRSLERAQAVVQETREGLTPLEDEKSLVTEKFGRNKGELLHVQSEQRSIRQHLTAVNGRIEKTKKDIEDEKQRLEDINGGALARKTEELEEARAKAFEAKAEFDRHRGGRARLESDLNDARKAAKDAIAPVEKKRAEIRQCEETLRNLQRDQGEHIRAFQDKMPVLLRAIRSHRGFREQPVGPAGTHVRLLKPEWSSILEKALAGPLNSFIVTSKHDQEILSELMRQVDCNCPILIGKSQALDTSNHEPAPIYDTVMRVLEIDNDAVKRQLIINQAIDQTLLISDWSEANHEMYSGPAPRNVKQCFCLHNVRRGWGMRLGFSRGGVESTSNPMPPMIGRPRMKTDCESQIRMQRENLQYLERENVDLQREARDLHGRVKACEQAINRHDRQTDELRVQVQRAEANAERLQDELEANAIQDGRLDALKAALQEAEEEKTILENSYGDGVVSRDKLNAIASELNAQLRSFDEQIQDLAAKIKKAEMNASRQMQARHTALQEKNQAISAVQDAKDAKRQEEARRRAQAQHTLEFAGQAANVGPRVAIDPGETAESLDKKLSKLVEDVNRFERQIGASREVIAQEAADAKTAFQTAQSQIQGLAKLAQTLKRALLERQERWRQFRRWISARARAQFMYLLAERGFRGMLKTDHRQHVLELHVEPDETRVGKGRQTKTLSGGEKSFSTICLLLSLWEAMGSPIRCLDEFDVFMDNVNRDISLKMMIGAARRSVGRQYVLITPQSMGNVDVAGDVKIIKLSDPERGQTTLPFTA